MNGYNYQYFIVLSKRFRQVKRGGTTVIGVDQPYVGACDCRI